MKRRFLFPRCAAVALLVLASTEAGALVNRPARGNALTEARTGGPGSEGTYGVGPVSAAPDLFTGALLHTIPISVVPGRRGLQPDVALRYRSTNGNGPVGVGWEMELGSIERRRKDGLNYLGDDYVLRVGGSAVDLINTGAGTYSARFESAFLRIKKLPATDGKTYWEVTDRLGTKSLFGETAAARQDDPASASTIFRWCLDKVQDTNGNYYAVSYSKSNAQVLPLEIDYTAHTSGLTATNAVLFNWELRTDPIVDLALIFSVNTSVRLKSIDVKAGGQLVRRYKLDYVSSSGTGRSLLSAVTQVGKDGTSSLPATSFDWAAQGGRAGLAGVMLASNKYNSFYGSPGRIRSAGVTGDGYDSVVLGPDANGWWFVLKGAASGGLIDDHDWIRGAFGKWAGNDSTSGTGQSHMWTADITGDGKQSVVIGPDPDYDVNNWRANWYVLRSTGTGFVQEEWLSSSAYGNWWGHATSIRVFDVDGDGKADILIGPDSSGNWFLLQNTGSGFVDRGVWIPGKYGNFAGDGNAVLIHPMDVTGDGLIDLVLGPDHAGNWYVLENTGSGGFIDRGPWINAYGPVQILTGGWSYPFDPTQVRVAELNGDGKADLLLGPDSGGNFAALLSTGTSFVNGGRWATSSYGGNNANRVRAIDVNGDGLTDVLLGPNSNGEWFVMQNDGTKLVDQGRWLSGAGGDAALSQGMVAPLDANGDGRLDVVMGPDSNGNWTGALATSPTLPTYYPDLIYRLRNGYGAVTTVQYQPSTAFTNRQLPFATQLVTSITVDDGNGISATTQYAYSGGYYHLANRDFRGFASVTVTGPAWPNGARPTTTTYFHQGNDVAVGVNDPTGMDGNMKGKPWRVVSGDTQSTATFTTDTTYGQSGVNPPFFNPVVDVVSSFCASGGNCGRQTHVSFGTSASPAYDAYGNVTREDHYGDTSDPNDDFTVIRTWSPNTTAWIVGLPTSETTYGGTGSNPPPAANQAAQTLYYYDGATDCSSQSSNLTPALGNPTRVARWLNGATATYIETRAAFDAYGNAFCARDANGNVTQMAYDSALKTFPITVTTPPAANAPSGLAFTTTYYGVNGASWTSSASDPGIYGMAQSNIDPNGASTSISYDVFGRKSSSSGPDYFSTAFSYNSFGAVGSQNVRTISPLGTAETYFDGLGRSIKTRRQASSASPWITDSLRIYLASGAIAQTCEPFFESGGRQRWTSYAYDVRGRVLKMSSPDGSAVTSCYDDLAGVAVTLDQNLHRRRQVNDVRGKRTRVDEYKGSFPTCTTDLGTSYATTNYHYDLFSNLDQVLNAVGSPLATAYDTVGRRISSSDPDLGNWSYKYDAAGNLIYQQDSKGQAINYRYDALNRTLLKHYCATADLATCSSEAQVASDVAFTYDAPAAGYSKGRLTRMTDASGSTSYSYDVMGRTTSTTQAIDTTATFVTQHSFDSSTRRLSTITYPDPSQSVVIYSYDGDGNLQQVRDAGHVYATLSQYDELGRPGNMILDPGGQNLTVSYSFDPINRRLSQLRSGSLLNLTYQYDPVGNVKTITDGITSANNQSFMYDELNRLLTAQSPSYDPGSVPRPGLIYRYDPVRVHVLNSTTDGNAFVHDLNGNRTSDGVRTFAWDRDNRPTCIAMAGASCSPISGSPTTITYDGTGARVKKQGTSGNLLYAGKLYECSGASCLRHIFAGNARIASVDVSGIPAYLHRDHLGSTRFTTTGAATSESIFYQPHGRTVTDSSPNTTRYKFTGQELDSETGLYNHGARLHDPTLGRFVSPDTIIQDMGNPQSLNRYSYAANNPLRYTDPSGHIVIVDDILVGAAIGAAVGAAFAALTHHDVLRGIVTGAITGGTLGFGGGIATVAELGANSLGAAAINATAGAYAGVLNAGTYGGNIGEAAALGAVSAGLAGLDRPGLGAGLFHGRTSFWAGLGGTALQLAKASGLGAAYGAGQAAIEGGSLGDGALQGARIWTEGELFNMGVGHLWGMVRSLSFPKVRDGMWFYQYTSSDPSRGSWMTFGNVITGTSNIDIFSNKLGAPKWLHEASHTSQSAAMSWSYTAAHLVSLIIGEMLGDAHKYNLLETYWIDTPH